MAILTAKGREYQEAVTTLDSEREANAILTAENACLTEERGALMEGLRWYAEPHIYAPHPNGPAFADRDLSWHARSVLRSEERRVGKQGVSQGRSRGSAAH